MSTAQRIDDLLEQASADLFRDDSGACADAETWHRHASGDTEPREAELLDQHRATCTVCSAEYDLARLFVESLDAEAPVDELALARVRRSARAATRERLSASPPAQTLQGRVRRYWPIAALLVLALGSLTFLTEGSLPEVSGPGVDGPVRGARIDLTSPVGAVAADVGPFDWTVRDGVALYALTVERVDRSVIWQSDVSVPPVTLPAEVAAGLEDSVTYRWSVRGLSEDGDEIARSEVAEFSIDAGDSP